MVNPALAFLGYADQESLNKAEDVLSHPQYVISRIK